MFHLCELKNSLENLGVECKLVGNLELYTAFPHSRLYYAESLLNYLNVIPTPYKFNRVIEEFRPDIVLTDSQSHFGLMTLRSEIPLLMHLRGDYWSEMKWARDTLYRAPHKRFALWWKDVIAEKCFQGTTRILPICNYLANVVKTRYPNKKIDVLQSGIRSSLWNPVEGMDLKHPCVGLLQGAHIWGKTEEMFVLSDVMKSMPHVTFYWAGDGPYKDYVLPALQKHENFKWLGPLKYPEQARQYLAGIDIYALVTGMDMSPLTIQEASLMQKPVVATNIGGVPELMDNPRTGFLVKKGDAQGWVETLSLLLNDPSKAKQMGVAARDFTIENFSWDVIAQKFLRVLESAIS